MSQAALQLVGAELDQTSAETFGSAPQAEPAGVSAQSEASHLAELAAAFALFGMQIEQPGDPDFPLVTADLAYRAFEVAPGAPANDWAEPADPAQSRRGMHVDPGLPVKLIQATDWVIVAAAALP